MSTKPPSSSDIFWGIPKPQFTTIKPVNLKAEKEAIKAKKNPYVEFKPLSFTGQIDISPSTEEAQLKQTRDGAHAALLKARFEKFPKLDDAVGEKAVKASAERESAAGEKVWAARTLDEQQRVIDSAKGADEVDALYDQEKRTQAYLARKEEYRAKKAEKAKLQSAKIAPIPYDTLRSFVESEAIVKVTLENGQSLIGDLPTTTTLRTEKGNYNIDLNMMDEDAPTEIEVNGKALKVISIISI